jgi:hypothetical protein
MKRLEFGEETIFSVIEVIIKLFKFFVLIFIFFIIFNKIRKIKKYKRNQVIKKETKVALCARAKKENRYIKYYIEHYKNIGYNHLFFGDNNEIDGESLLDVKEIQDGIKEGFITVINRRGIKDKDQEWYYICYNNLSLEYDWISFFDFDEYLMLKPNGTMIQEFLEHPRFNSCEHVKINWRVYTDNDQLDFEDKNPMERFPIETKYTNENKHIKSIIRGGLNYSNMTKNYSPHSVFSNLKACTSSGKTVIGKLYYNYPPDIENAVINHYVTKSVREFAIKKCRSLGAVDVLDNATKKFLFDYFFKINNKNQQKVEIFNEIFHTDYK